MKYRIVRPIMKIVSTKAFKICVVFAHKILMKCFSSFLGCFQAILTALISLKSDIRENTAQLMSLRADLKDREIINKEIYTMRNLGERHTLDLPLQNDEQFTKFEEKLQHEEFCGEFVSFIMYITPNNSRALITICMYIT